MNFAINLHNQSAALAYKLACIKEDGNLSVKYYGHPKRDTLVKLSMDIFRSDYFADYDIKKDTALTLDKYKEYCKAHGYSPKEYIEFIKPDRFKP